MHSDKLGFQFTPCNGKAVYLVSPNDLNRRMWIHMIRASLPNAGALEPSLRRASCPEPSDENRANDIHAIWVALICAPKGEPDVVFQHLARLVSCFTKDALLETNFPAPPASPFMGRYNAREGIVEFVALFRETFHIASVGSRVSRQASDSHIDISSVYSMGLAHCSSAPCRMTVEVHLTPAGRANRMVLLMDEVATPFSPGTSTSLFERRRPYMAVAHQAWASKRAMYVRLRSHAPPLHAH
jgi:hypothetical protein